MVNSYLLEIPLVSNQAFFFQEFLEITNELDGQTSSWEKEFEVITGKSRSY